jgi:tetratricopeptide (TPR) repeat protein
MKSAPDIFFTMAIICYYLNNFHDAVKYYQLSIEYFSATYPKLYNLAVSYLQTGQPGLARECISQAFGFISGTEDSDYPELLQLYGESLSLA